LISAIVALGSFLGAMSVYRSQRHMARAAEIARLHQMWWGDEFRETRNTVFGFVDEWEKNRKSVTPVIRSYQQQSAVFEPERRTIGRVAFFFADLNAMIDAGVVDEKFAYRIFGEAQFSWFSEFLLAVANEIEVRRASESPDSRRAVRWVKEVRELDRRFRRIGKKLE
jgi:hypothetical protein